MDGIWEAARARDEYSIPQAWSIATLSKQTDDSELKKNQQKILNKINNHLLKMRKGFASDLLDHSHSAVTSQFNTLLDEVESKYKLLLAFAELTGRTKDMQASLAKLMNARNIREKIQQYSQSASVIYPIILEEFGVMDTSIDLTAEIAKKATKKATAPSFIEQVRKQYEELNSFTEFYSQRRALIEAMDFTQPNLSTKDEDDSDVQEVPSKEAMDKKR